MDHVIEAAAPAKYKHIDFKPPEGVRKAAKRGLEMRREFKRGGTAVGVARARDLMNGKTISPSTARRMKAYFDRHQPDQKAEGFDSGEDGYPSAGRVAWCLPYDAQVLLADGTHMPIGRIVEERLAVEVVTRLEDGTLANRPVTNWFCADAKKSDFVVIRRGRASSNERGVWRSPKLVATAEHPVWTQRGWVPAGEVNEHDLVHVTEPWVDSVGEQVIAGHMVGDGYLTAAKQLSMSRCDADADYLHDTIRLTSRLRWSAPRLHIPKDGYGEGHTQWVSTTAVTHRLEPMVKVVGGQRVLVGDLDRLGLVGLARWVCDDGSLHEWGYRLHTEAFDAPSVEKICSWLRIIGYDVKSHQRENTDGHVVYFTAESSRLLSSRIAPFVPPSMRRKVYQCDADVPYTLADHASGPVFSYSPQEIMHRRPAAKADTPRGSGKGYWDRRYDITVADGHSFVANGVIVHNCLWGGDAGYSWAKKLVKQMNSADEKGKVRSSADDLEALIDEVLRASYSFQTPVSIFRPDRHWSRALKEYANSYDGYEDLIEAVDRDLSKEKLLYPLQMMEVRFLLGLISPALTGNLKHFLTRSTSYANLGRKNPITEQDVLLMALRQADDVKTENLSDRHKTLLAGVKKALKAELRVKELTSGEPEIKVPEMTKKTTASNCGCAESCDCGCQAPGGGQPPSDMTISNLKQIIRDASELLEILHEDMELMGWAEDKVTQAKVAVDSVKNYVLNDFTWRSEPPIIVKGSGTEWWRRAGRISLDEAEKGFKYFRIIPPSGSEYFDGDDSSGASTIIEKPRIPKNTMTGEDRLMSRVSLSPGIWEAIAGVAGDVSANDLKEDEGKLEEAGGRVWEWYVYGTNHEDVLQSKDIVQYVPDAMTTKEVWSKTPVNMSLIGTIGCDFEDVDSAEGFSIWVVPKRAKKAKHPNQVDNTAQQQNKAKASIAAALRAAALALGGE